MLVLVQHLIRSGRIDRARARALGRLLARFEAQPGPRSAPPRVRALAQRVAQLKRELSEAIGEVRSCAGCADGCVTPSGYFDGGRCCGTRTDEVFTRAEVRAIKLAGVPPPTEPAEGGAAEAGCLFRGPRGCARPPEGRPAKCLVYVCHELRIELEDTPRFERIQRLRRTLDDLQAELASASR